ncbi:MAG TPA: GMC family oxidoreductase [Cyclobacteriaceae bacterium]|nr:GMC family oxidoreductase [Cyclobacteriaceae bacterium]
MNLNIDAREGNTYDAIVVGSGISGGWAAKELCEKGLKVLMLERGRKIEHPNYPTTTLDPWQFEHRGRLTLDDREKHHIQVRHYSIHEQNKHFYINDNDNPYVERKRYDWIRGDTLGGRSLLWGRHCYRLSDLDFSANVKDGIAVDWPIRYRDLIPWYDYVEKFTGISGQAENIPHLPDGNFLPAMEFNCVEKAFKVALEEKFPGRKVIMGRVANLTEEKKGRGKCQFRNRCDQGCPYGAYFSTNSATLPAALATNNLNVVTDSLVNRVIYDEKKGRAKGVEVINTQTNEVTEYYSRIIFVNASTLGTTFILLNSTSSRFPNGLGNDSDQVGRNLMDHHKGSGASALVEGYEDKYYSGRRPNSLYLPRFQNIDEKRKDFIRGYGLLGGAGRSGWSSSLFSPAIGEELKIKVQTPGPWGIYFGGYGECLPYQDNRVTLSADKKDKWGRPSLEIDCEFKENEKIMNKHMPESMAEMLEAVGFKNVKKHSEMSFPGNANHEMGTARMGRDPKTSVVNSFNQMHAVPNVFITDGSCMASSGCANPSLTYMALTARACYYAVEEMKKQNI